MFLFQYLVLCMFWNFLSFSVFLSEGDDVQECCFRSFLEILSEMLSKDASNWKLWRVKRDQSIQCNYFVLECFKLIKNTSEITFDSPKRFLKKSAYPHKNIKRKFHDYLTQIKSTEKLLTQAGFELAPLRTRSTAHSTSWAIESLEMVC